MKKSLSSLISEIKTQTKRLGYSIEDYFADIDPKESGILTVHQFRKVLTNLKIWIDDNSFMAIVKQFLNEDNKVEYKLFLDEFYADELGKDPSVDEDILAAFGNDLLVLGISLTDILSPHDRYNSGSVPAAIFKDLIPSKYASEVSKMLSKPPYYEIRYIELNNTIMKLASERAGTKKTMKSTITAETLKESKIIEDDVIPKVAASMRINGIDANSIFPKYDKYKQGTIPREKFLREVYNFGLPLPPEDIEGVADAFSSKNGNIDYVSFINIVNQEQESSDQKIKTETITQQKREIIIPDVEATCDYVKQAVNERRAHMRGLFENFDPMRTGKVSKDLFKTLLTTEGYSLTQMELNGLSEKFEVDEEHVDYNSFADRVETKRAPVSEKTDKIKEELKNHLEKRQFDIRPKCQRADKANTGLITFDSFLAIMREVSFPYDDKEKKLLRICFTDANGDVNIEKLCEDVNPIIIPEEEEEEPVPNPTQTRDEPTEEEIEALARIAAITKSSNVDLLNSCKDMSNNNFGLMKESQFKSVMLGIGNVTQEDIDILSKRYAGKAPKEICYRDLAADIDNYGDAALKENPKLDVTIKEEKEIEDDIIPILKHIKAQLSLKGIDSNDLFAPYDHRRSGIISKQRFISVFKAERINITMDDLEKLLDTFEDLNDSDYCNYRKVCSKIESESVTNEDLAAFKTVKITPSTEVLNILAFIKSKLYTRRRKPEDMFRGIAEKLIPSSEFRMQFSGVGINLREREMQAVIKQFRANMRCDIDWMSFCDAVNSVKEQM